jgi:tetratricopeptide (TPR) repeat protein
MTALHIHRRSPHVRALGIVAAMLAMAVASQVAGTLGPKAPSPVDGAPKAGPALDAGFAGGDAPTARGKDLERIRADIAFWSDRAGRRTADFISATEWAAVEIELARATGDLSAWRRAESATAQALRGDPAYGPAIGYRGTVLIALHRFREASDLARPILAARPNDPFALATLGDASLELGDLRGARAAYAALDLVYRSAPSQSRLSRLEYVEGSSDAAVKHARLALAMAIDEGAAGERLAWYHATLAELLAATSEAAGARDEWLAALAADPGSWPAMAGLARLDAAQGRIDEAIASLDAAIAIVPRPELLARRADLFALRGVAGDGVAEADDRATIEAIASLAGADAVYDRTLAIYLADHGLEPARAVRLARAELSVREDVFGYDALAWALLAAGRPAEAQAAMERALAVGTRDPRLLYHAGMIAAALDDAPRARELLEIALRLDPAFDPLQARRARATLEALP